MLETLESTEGAIEGKKKNESRNAVTKWLKSVMQDPSCHVGCHAKLYLAGS
jgi:hypothetical protein